MELRLKNHLPGGLKRSIPYRIRLHPEEHSRSGRWNQIGSYQSLEAAKVRQEKCVEKPHKKNIENSCRKISDSFFRLHQWIEENGIK
jgi:hypothetical protein